MPTGKGGRLIIYPTTQWYMTGLHFLWVYDYFLTLGDEVGQSLHCSIVVLDPHRYADNLRLVRNEIPE